MHPDDPDRAWDRAQQDADEAFSRERRADRIGDYTPANDPMPCRPAARITTAMVTLSHTVLEGPDFDRRDAARVLAELVIEASDR